MSKDEKQNIAEPNVVEVEDYDVEPSVPTDLLDLYVELEDKAVSPERFKEVFGS